VKAARTRWKFGVVLNSRDVKFAVLTQYRRVTDRRTKRIYRASMASSGTKHVQNN